MINEHAHAELIAVIRQVRKRWRTKLAIRGAVGFLVAGVLAIFAMAAALDYFRFSPAAIVWFRIIAAGVIPPEQVFCNAQYRPEMQGVDVPGDTYSHVAGIDVVRADGGPRAQLSAGDRSAQRRAAGSARSGAPAPRERAETTEHLGPLAARSCEQRPWG